MLVRDLSLGGASSEEIVTMTSGAPTRTWPPLGFWPTTAGYDQRGTPRSAPCDSGAYEHAP